MLNTDSTNKFAIAKILHGITFIFIPLAFGIISLLLGKDINWDLRNYHYYNAYAFLENRLDFDIVPAQLQTYINPIADIPFYWMANKFPSWVTGFILGCIHGFNLSFVFLIFRKITNLTDKWQTHLCGMCVVIISGTAPGFISELGNTMHDNLTSLFVLSTIFFLFNALKLIDKGITKKGFIYLGAGGLAMGIGVGIKPSIVIFAMSTAIVFITSQHSWINKVKSFFIYGITGISGGLISAGFWWWKMWSRFRNPFFPFYNNIFKSPYFTTTPNNWSSYLPNHLWEYLLWPFIFTFDSLRTNQFHFFDIRFSLLYILLLVWVIILTLRIFRLISPISTKYIYTYDTRLGNFLLLFFIFSYILWIKESATYRFMISLELLTPLCFLILLERVFPAKKMQMVFALGAFTFTLFLFKPFNWGRLEWSNSYFTVDTVDVMQFSQSKEILVVMLGSSPMSYIIPEFPHHIRFVRPEGNFFSYRDLDGNIRPRDDNRQIILTTIKETLKQQNEPFYILFNKNEPNIQPEESLRQLGILVTIKQCFPIKVNTPDMLEICQVTRKY